MNTLYVGTVFEAQVNDFPFVADLPKREKGKVAKLWDAFKLLREQTAIHGILVPRPLAAQLLDLSTQRIDQLATAGRLETVVVDGHVYVTEKALLAFAIVERKTGRPFKTAEKCCTFSGAMEVARSMVKK